MSGKALKSLMVNCLMAFLIVLFLMIPYWFPASAIAAVDPGIHNSINLGTKYGNWGAAYDCSTCHRMATTNIKGVETTINNRPVVFRQMTAALNSTRGVFGNDRRSYNQTASRNVCEVCHHRTLYHQYSASKIADKDHTGHDSNNIDCTGCHKHKVGFKRPDAGSCDSCHGNPPLFAGELTTTALAFASGAPAPGGAHGPHRLTEKMTCDVCHYNWLSNHGLKGNKGIEITFNINKNTWPDFVGVVTNGTFTGTMGTFSNNIGTFSKYTTMPYNPGTTLVKSATPVASCNLYCHGDNWVIPSGRIGSGVSWVQGSLGDCSNASCHGTTSANPPTPSVATGAHLRHVGTLQMACDKCHYNFTTPHMVNGRVVWDMSRLSATATYKGFNNGSTNTLATTAPYGNCANLYCHSNVQSGNDGTGAPTYAAPVTWGGGVLTCDGCHGGTRATANPISTGSHGKHVSTYAYVCADCHTGSGADNQLKHADGFIDLSFDAKYGGSYDQGSNTPGNGYGNCSANYCHSDGRGLTKTVNWLPGTTSCNSCHGGDAASAPDDINSGKHKAHINNIAILGSNYSCAECHSAVVSNNSTVISSAKHVNKFTDYSGVRAGKSSTYEKATGICSATYCHTDGKGVQKSMVAFGWYSSATMDCKGCHGSDAAPTFVSAAGEPNYPNEGANLPRSNSHERHMGGVGATTCHLCHNNTMAEDGKILSGSAHTNGTIDLAPGGGKSFVWNKDTKTCSGITCHGGSVDATWGQQFPSDCTGCHGNNANAAVKLTSGKHGQHTNQAAVLGVNIGCVECHAKTVLNDTTIKDTFLHGNGYKNYTGVNAGGSSTYSTITGICSASYCHSDGKGNQTMVAANNWNTGAPLDCTGCHGGAGSLAGEPVYLNQGTGSMANNHAKHVGTVNAGTTCVYCHGTTMNGSLVNASGKHLDRTIDVVNGGTKTFDYSNDGNKTCSNISCHGVASPAAQWGQTFAADCSGCHGGNANAGLKIVSGKHAEHTNQVAVLGANLGCRECHSQIVSNDTTIISQALHGNGWNNYSGANAGKNILACNTAYCHSNGKGGAGQAVSWTTGTMDCIGCHGTATGTGTFTSLDGEPNYANAGAGLLFANSHQSHIKNRAADCVTCHVNTVTLSGNTIKAGSLHINNSIDVFFDTSKAGLSAYYNNSTRTCNNISCHSGGNPIWGDPNSAGCKACHGNLLTKPGVHAAHINDLISSGMVTFYAYTANKSVGTLYRFGCANCHPTDEANKHKDGTIDVTLNKNKSGAGYLNGLNNLADSDTAGYTRTGDPKTNLTCELSYCHSNGKNTSLALGDYKASPNWYITAPTENKCGMCHENPPQYAGQSHYVASSSLGNNGTPPYQESGHMIGIHSFNTYAGNDQNGFLGFSSSGNKAHGNSALANTISCNTCHSGIVSDTVIDTYAMNGKSSQFNCSNISCHSSSSKTILQSGQITNTARHINGFKDIVFPNYSTKTKAQVANVIDAPGWTRYGSYKSPTSYDRANLGTSSWSRDGNGKVTCTNACHMNTTVTWGTDLTCASCHVSK
jgi:predicted CxxxxCH...CXXCH cytochrome family protein